MLINDSFVLVLEVELIRAVDYDCFLSLSVFLMTIDLRIKPCKLLDLLLSFGIFSYEFEKNWGPRWAVRLGSFDAYYFPKDGCSSLVFKPPNTPVVFRAILFCLLSLFIICFLL